MFAAADLSIPDVTFQLDANRKPSFGWAVRRIQSGRHRPVESIATMVQRSLVVVCVLSLTVLALDDYK